jgi:hypothetical protein
MGRCKVKPSRSSRWRGRPPKTIEVPDPEGGTYRYGLGEWSQEGMTALYTFLYPV